LEFIEFSVELDDPQNLEKQTPFFPKNSTGKASEFCHCRIGLGSPSGDGVPITGARKSLTTTTPKDDAGKCVNLEI